MTDARNWIYVQRLNGIIIIIIINIIIILEAFQVPSTRPWNEGNMKVKTLRVARSSLTWGQWSADFQNNFCWNT